jgi:hypothetical protein
VLLLLVLVGYFYVQQRGVFSVSQAEILARLQEKLPITNTYLFVFEVTLDNPRVQLIEASNRVNAGLDLMLRIRLLSELEPMHGLIDASASVRYDSDRAAFYLADPRIESLEMDALPAEFVARSRGVITDALKLHFQDNPIYKLSDRQAHRVLRSVLIEVVIKDDRLVLRMGSPTQIGVQ